MENIFFNDEQKNFYNLNPTPNEPPKQLPFYNKYLSSTYMQPSQGSTEGILLDPSGISDRSNWDILPKRQPLTEPQVRSQTQALALLNNEVVNNTLISGGVDPSQAPLIRQMIGLPTFNEIIVNEEDINDTNLINQKTQLDILAKTDLTDPENLKAFKKQSEVVTYIQARLNGFEQKPIEMSAENFYRSQGVIGKAIAGGLGVWRNLFDTPELIKSVSDNAADTMHFLGIISDDEYKLYYDVAHGGLPSTSMNDIVAAVDKFDPKFNHIAWFNTKIASDPYVKDGLLNYGVTEDMFRGARNETHARMMLMSRMNSSNIQQQVADYVPSTTEKFKGFFLSFKDGMVGSGVDLATEVGVELGISAGISLIPAGVTQAAGAAKAGLGIARFGRRALGFAKWGLTGDLPRVAMQWGVVRRALATATVGAGWGAAQNYMGQQNNIALANALYYYNPEMKSSFDWDEVGNAAVTGAIFGGSLSILGSSVASAFPAFRNARVKRLAKAGILSPEKAMAIMEQHPFAITLNNFKRLTNGTLFRNVDPISGTIHTAVSKGKQPELSDINDASRTAANAVDAAEAVATPKQADKALKPSLDNRGGREELLDFIDRGIRGGTIKSLNDVLDNLSTVGPWSSLTTKQKVHLLEQLNVPAVQKKLQDVLGEIDAPDDVKQSATVLAGKLQLFDETKAKLRATLSVEDLADVDNAVRLNKPLDETITPQSSTRKTVEAIFDSVKNNKKPVTVSETKPEVTPAVTPTPEVTPAAAVTPTAAVTPEKPTINVTQERVDAATAEAKEDMALRTERELNDPKVKKEIEDTIEAMLFGREGKTTLRRILRGSRKARKLSPAQQKRITGVLTNPAAFIEEARGNKEHITAYYKTMQEFVASGRLTEADVRIILAATVNLNWNSGAASIISKLVGGERSMVDPVAGEVTVGEYFGKPGEMNRIKNVLHEIGHVFEMFGHGSSLMNIRNLFSSEADFIVSLRETLDTDQINKYYLGGNTQELMAEAFSVMMIDEVRLAAFINQAPNQGLVRKMLMQKFVSIGQSLMDVLDSLKLSKVLEEEQVFKSVKEMLSLLDKNSGLLISRIVYQDTVMRLLSDREYLTTRELQDKINRELIRIFQPTQDELTLSQKQISYLFTEDEIAALVEYTSSEQVTPIHVDAFLNTKLDGLSLKKNRTEFIDTMSRYLKINKKYFSSVIDIYNQSLVENGYPPIKRSGSETEISPADISQYLDTEKKKDARLQRKTMLSTPDVLMRNFFSYSLGKAAAKLGAPVRALEDLTLIEQLKRASVRGKRLTGLQLIDELTEYLNNFRKNYIGTETAEVYNPETEEMEKIKVPAEKAARREQVLALQEQTLLTPLEISLFDLVAKSPEFNDLIKTIEVTTVKYNPEVHGTNPSNNYLFKPNQDKTGGTLELLEFDSESKNIGSIYTMFKGFAEAAVVLNKQKKLKKIIEKINNNPTTQAEKAFANSQARDPVTGKLVVMGHYTPRRIKRKSGGTYEWNVSLKATLLFPHTDMLGYGVYLTNRESDGETYLVDYSGASNYNVGEYAYYYYANIENPIIINPIKEGKEPPFVLQDITKKLKKEYMEKFGLKTDQELAMHLDAGPGQWRKHFSKDDARINFRYEDKEWNFPDEFWAEQNEAAELLAGDIPESLLNVLIFKKFGYDGIIVEDMTYRSFPNQVDPKAPEQQLRHYVVFNPSTQLMPIYSNKIIPNDSPRLVQNTAETLGHIDGLLGAPERESDDSTLLLTTTNISSSQFFKVVKSGGDLIAPSMGVVTAEKGSTATFGDITLIGTKSHIDPETGVPVYSGDAYTVTLPEQIQTWLPSKNPQALEKLEKFFKVLKNYSSSTPSRNNLQNLIDKVLNATPPDGGSSPVLKKEDGSYDFLDQPFFIRMLEQHIETYRLYAYISGISISDTDWKTITKKLETKNFSLSNRGAENLLQPYGINTKDFYKWLFLTTSPFFSTQFVDASGKLVDWNDDNLFHYMQGHQQRGIGVFLDDDNLNSQQLASLLISQFSSIEEMRSEAKTRITDTKEHLEDFAKLDATLNALRESSDNYHPITNFDLNFGIGDEAFYERYEASLGKPLPFHQVLLKYGFPKEHSIVRFKTILNEFGYATETVPLEFIENVFKYLDDLKTSKINYFEAKPIKKIPLSSFIAAVLPKKSLTPELEAAFQKVGLRYETYETVLLSSDSKLAAMLQVSPLAAKAHKTNSENRRKAINTVAKAARAYYAPKRESELEADYRKAVASGKIKPRPQATKPAASTKAVEQAEKMLRDITDKTLFDKLTEGLTFSPETRTRDLETVRSKIQYGLNTGDLQIGDNGVIRFSSAYESGIADPITIKQERPESKDPLTPEQEDLLDEVLQNPWQYIKRIQKIIINNFSVDKKYSQNLESHIAEIVGNISTDKGFIFFKKRDGTDVATGKELRLRIAKAAYNKFLDEQKKLTGKSSAGLTASNWRKFIDAENESLEVTDTLFGKRGEKLTSDLTDEAWLANEKKNQSQLFQRFEKEYRKVYSPQTEKFGDETVVTRIDVEEKELPLLEIRKEKANQLVELADLGFEIYGKNKATMNKRKFVVASLAKGLTTDEILEEAAKFKIKLADTKDISDTFSDVVVSSRGIIETAVKKQYGKSIEDVNDKDLMAVLKALIENQKKLQEPKQAVAKPSKQEIIEQVTESIEQQNEVNAIDRAIESTPPEAEPTVPIIKPEETVGPVTVVANRRNKPITPLTPHVKPAVAESAMDGRPRNSKGQFISSGVKTKVEWTTASAAAWHNADGMAGNYFFASLKTIQTILNGVSHPQFTKDNINPLLVFIKQLYKDGKEKEAVSRFLDLMKKLDIKAVRVVDPRTGQTTMKFLFSEYEWSYGGITRAEPAKVAGPKKTVDKPTKAPEAAPEASEEKPIPQPPKKQKAAEAKPRAAKPSVRVTVERGPNNKDIPVIEPLAKPDTTVQPKRPKDTQGSDNRSGTDLPLTTEAEQVMVGLTESNESLRDGGTDAGSFKFLLAKFLKSLDKKARNAMLSGIPDAFKEMFLEFVDINSAIMHRNRARFANNVNIVQDFWKQVTKLLAEEDANKVSLQYYKPKTLKEIYRQAAQNISTETQKFTPPLIPDNVTIKDGKMSLKGVDNELLNFINNRNKEPIIPPTTEAKVARQKQTAQSQVEPMPGVENSKPKELKVDEIPEEEKLTLNTMLDNIMDVFNNSSSMLLRQNNFISFIFGGSERSNRNIWRTFMSKSVNFIQSKTRLGSTTRSMQRSMRLLSAMFDDTKTMVGQLVAPGATPLRSANRAKTEAIMLVSNLAKIHRIFASEITKLKLTNGQVKQLQRLQIEAWQKKVSPTAKEIQELLGIADADDIAAVLNKYREEMIHINKVILDLERKTGWREVVDKNGEDVPADEYLPIQIVVQKLNDILMDNQKYAKLVRSLVETRTQSKLNDDMLDINTLIVMGILDIEDVKTFYTKNRKFVETEATYLDNETLEKLFVTTVTSPTGLDKYFGIKGKKYFTIKKGDVINVYRVPETIEDLSKADLDRYYKTVSGSSEHVLDKWKKEFSGLSLVEVEIRDLLDYKAKRGRHARTIAGTRNDRPDIDTNHYENYQSTIRNFSTAEILGNPELFELARTDLHAAYQNFVRYRVFDLLFQETIDKLAGQTGLRPKQFLMMMEERILRYIDEFDSIKPEDKVFHKQDVYDGMSRLMWQYAEYNGSIPRSGIGSRQTRNAAKSLRGVINMAGGIAYGVAQSPEAVGEFIKSSIRTGGLSIPVGIFRLVSNLLNVLTRGDSHHRFQIDDLATSIEDWHQEHTTHLNEGIADANFDMDLSKPYKAIWETPNISGGISGLVADNLAKLGQTAVLLGGVTDNTNLTRYYAKARHYRKLLKMIRSGKIRKFLELREEPTIRAEMERLLKASERSEKAERQLTKLYKRLAREAGLSEFDAIYAVTSGLDSITNLDAISWGLNHANALDGVIDFRELHLAYRDLGNMTNPPINPEVYQKAIVDFQEGIERRIRKRSVTASYGLNRSMGVLEGSEQGKVLAAITSYMSSFYDDVMLNAPNRGTTNLLIGTLVFYAVLETLIGLFREWASGREIEDMLNELESDPESMIIRVATRLPMVGSFTPLLEAAVRTVHNFTGGTSNPNQLVQSLVSTGIGGSPIVGANSTLSLLRKVIQVPQAMFDDDPSTSPGQKLLAVPGHFINKSPLMIPARIIEERANIDETNALQWILDGIQTQPNPYSSRSRSGRGSRSGIPLGSAPTGSAPRSSTAPGLGKDGMETYTPKEPTNRNYVKEKALQVPIVPPGFKTDIKQESEIDLKGVSPLLTRLLGRSQ